MEARFLDSLIRLKMLYGSDAVERLKEKKVAVFGVGGVGSFTVEALSRSGIGHLTLVDFDRVAVSNINRQLPARMDTIDRLKVEVLKENILKIQPDCKIKIESTKFKNPIETGEFLSTEWDYLVDAIDDIPAKTELLVWAFRNKIPVVSMMGAGNKVNPTLFQIADISKTHTCPLARSLRKTLKEKGITEGITTVFSTEVPQKPQLAEETEMMIKHAPGSVCHTTGTAGLIVASVVINHLTDGK